MEADSPRTLRGVPLVQLAAVHAALAEGFVLDEVLALEALPAAVWFEAEVSWKARLVSDAAALDAYRASLSAQQDRLTRRVTPLRDELEAWIQFLRCYADHPDPCDLLMGLGLCLNDMARLGRVWEQRFTSDNKLAKQAGKLSLKLESRIQRGDKPRLPLVEVVPAILRPSPAAGSYQPPKDAAAAAADQASLPLLGLDQYAALSADLRVAKEKDKDAVLLRHGLSARDALLIDEAWRARLHTDRELFSDFRVLVAHYEQGATLRQRSAKRASLAPTAHASTPAASPPWVEVVAPASPAPAGWSGASASGMHAAPSLPPPVWLQPLPIAAPPESLPTRPSRTEPGMVMATMQVLPFRGAVRALPSIADQLPPRPPRQVDDIDATTDVIPALLDGEVMPFDARAGAEEAALEDAGADLDGTMLLGAISFDDDAPLPFMPSRSAELDTSASWVISISDDDVISLDATGSFEVLDEEPLGWVEAEPAAALAPEQVQVFDIGDDAGDEADLDTTTLWRVIEGLDDEELSTPASQQQLDGTAILYGLDFGLDDEPVSQPHAAQPHAAQPHAAQPHAAQPHAAQPSPAPSSSGAVSLTLDQLASLHAELAVNPAHEASIRARYGLADAAALAHCESQWRARFETAPDEHARYQHKLASFRAWLSSRTE